MICEEYPVCLDKYGVSGDREQCTHGKPARIKVGEVWISECEGVKSETEWSWVGVVAAGSPITYHHYQTCVID